MGASTIHDFVLWYISAAVVVAVGAFALADLIGSADPPRGPSRAALAVIAGAVWPVLAVGALQWFALRAVANRLRLERVRRETQPMTVSAQH